MMNIAYDDFHTIIPSECLLHLLCWIVKIAWTIHANMNTLYPYEYRIGHMNHNEYIHIHLHHIFSGKLTFFRIFWYRWKYKRVSIKQMIFGIIYFSSFHSWSDHFVCSCVRWCFFFYWQRMDIDSSKIYFNIHTVLLYKYKKKWLQSEKEIVYLISLKNKNLEIYLFFCIFLYVWVCVCLCLPREFTCCTGINNKNQKKKNERKSSTQIHWHQQ